MTMKISRSLWDRVFKSVPSVRTEAGKVFAAFDSVQVTMSGGRPRVSLWNKGFGGGPHRVARGPSLRRHPDAGPLLGEIEIRVENEP